MNNDDLKMLTIFELREYSLKVQGEMNDIKSQIEEHLLDNRFIDSPTEEDERWVHKAKYSLRMKGIRHQAINLELSRRKSAEKIKEMKFRTAAKQVLDEDTYNSIVARIKENETKE